MARGRQGSSRGLKRDPDTGIWHIDVSVKGRRIQRSCFTQNKTQAEVELERARRALWDATVGDTPPDITWAELAAEHLGLIEQKGNRTVEDTRDKLRWLDPHIGHMQVRDITERHINAVLTTRRMEGRSARLKSARKGAKPIPLKPVTLNRWWAAISAMLHLAFRRGYIKSVPQWEGRVPEPRGKARVVRWITPAQFAKLVAELPEHLRPICRFAVATGLRKDNVCSLEWEQIDLPRKQVFVTAETAKGKKNFCVPLSDEAMAILREVHGQHDRYVFTFQHSKKRPRRRIDEPAGRAWKNAKERAGIDPAFRFHDLRHTWATWHVQTGTPIEVLKELGAWSTLEMVLVYAHHSETHLAKYANNSAAKECATPLA